MVQDALFRVVAVAAQGEADLRPSQILFERIDDRRATCPLRHDGAGAAVFGDQHQLAGLVGGIEHHAGQPIQERTPAPRRQFMQPGPLGPIAQRIAVAGELQATLDEQAGELAGDQGRAFLTARWPGQRGDDRLPR